MGDVSTFGNLALRRRTQHEPRQLPAPGPRLRPVAPPGTVTCSACSRRFVAERFETQMGVCAECGHHAPVTAPGRIAQLADSGTIEMLQFDDLGPRDPLNFDDGARYEERLSEAQRKTGLHETFCVARAAITKQPVVIAAMDFAFLGGSLGIVAGEIFARACDIAVAEQRALVAVCVSGGARMQEGIASLAQMARCSNGIVTLAAARLPYISILGDPCFGGVTASFATQADVILAEPQARIGFAGGRVIEQATHGKLPPDFQSAEFLLDHGMVDAVVDRREIKGVIGNLLIALTSGAGHGHS
jgi:acyl-CoA carboxylase subunit beta